jgi:alkanesulfonate monooxygenase SsuD/methylene tetrahydromethanopterin reductase-like flavin-dependent oxidoreductase (luciferase family)
MKFAPFMLFQQSEPKDDSRTLRGEVDTMVLAEDMGFDGVYMAEHICSPYSLAASPACLAGAVAARTRSIDIGMAVLVLPLDHPLRIAADWATVDVLSEGRVVLGLGAGYNWYEFDSLGVELIGANRRFAEELTIIREAWKGEHFSFKGEFYNIESTQLLPKPMQTPAPLLYYAGSGSPETVQMAATAGMGLCVSYSPPSVLTELRCNWVSHAKEAGHSNEEIDRILTRTPTTNRIVWVAETDEQAERECRAMVKRNNEMLAAYAYPGYGHPGREHPHNLPMVSGFLAREAKSDEQYWDEIYATYGVLAGSPATVRSRLKELVDQAPIDYLLLWCSLGSPPAEDQQRSLRLFSDKVMPHFK